MATNISIPSPEGDLLLIKLAREIAIEMREVPDILQNHHLTQEEWDEISAMPRFQQLLASEVEAWNSAVNTSERVRLKSAAMIEEWLPEAFKQMHNPEASLLHKTEIAKVLGRISGLDKGPMSTDGNVEKFSVTINLGADQQLSFTKEVPSKVIEHEN